MAIIDELVAVLALDYKGKGEAKKFSDDMDKAGKSAAAFAAKAAAIGTAIGAALGVGLTKIAGMTSDVAGEMDKLAKQSTKIGFSTDALQELRFAAGQMAGLGEGVVDTALQRFSRRMAEAGEGTGEALKVVEKYGVALKDSAGNMRKPQELLGEFADIIANTSDEGERLRIAFKLFDTEGAGMVNMLSEGSKGMEEYTKKARDLGLVMRRDAIEQSEKFAELQERIDKGMKSVRNRIAFEFMPTFNRWMEKGLAAYERLNMAGTVDRVAGAIGSAFRGTVNTVEQLGKAAWDVGKGFYYAADGIVALVSKVTGLSKGAVVGGVAAGVGAKMLGRKALMALASRIPAIAALVALEDVLAELRGDESVIGSTEEGAAAVERLGEAADKAANAWKKLGDATAEAREKITAAAQDQFPDYSEQIAKLEKQIDGLGGYAGDVAERLGLLFTDPLGLAMNLLTGAIDRLSSALETVTKGLQAAADFIKDPIGTVSDLEMPSGRDAADFAINRTGLSMLPESWRDGILDMMGFGEDGPRRPDALDAPPRSNKIDPSRFDMADSDGNISARPKQAGGVPELNGLLDRMLAAQASLQPGNAQQKLTQTLTTNDNRQFPVSVSAPVHVHVQNATNAPGRVGDAVSRAVHQGAGAGSQKARMAGIPSTAYPVTASQ